jgi:hypothetical protein
MMCKVLLYKDPYASGGQKTTIELIAPGTWFLGNVRQIPQDTIPTRLFYKDHENTLLGFDNDFNQICSKNMGQVLSLVENVWSVDIRIAVYPDCEAPYALSSAWCGKAAHPGIESKKDAAWYGRVANDAYEQRVFMLCDGRIKALDQHVQNKALLTYGSSWNNACPFYWAFEAGINVYIKRKPFDQKSTFKVEIVEDLKAACDKLVAKQ